MRYLVRTTRKFEIELKRLSKRYPSLTQEVSELVVFLKSNPTHGIAMGAGIYKLRLSIKSKGKGKSGGARVITFVHFKAESVDLISIYDKSEQDSIKIDELRQIVEELNLNN